MERSSGEEGGAGGPETPSQSTYGITRGPGEDLEATVGAWLGESDFLTLHIEEGDGDDPDVAAKFAMSRSTLLTIGQALGQPKWQKVLHGDFHMWLPETYAMDAQGFIAWLEGHWAREFPGWLEKYRESKELKRKRDARHKAKKRAKAREQ